MNLKAIRKKSNLTQEEASKIAEISLMAYGRYENETREPSIKALMNLANYYNVSLDYLVGREYSSPIGYLSEQELSFVQLYLTLNELNKEKIAIYLSGLLAGQN